MLPEIKLIDLTQPTPPVATVEDFRLARIEEYFQCPPCHGGRSSTSLTPNTQRAYKRCEEAPDLQVDRRVRFVNVSTLADIRSTTVVLGQDCKCLLQQAAILQKHCQCSFPRYLQIR